MNLLSVTIGRAVPKYRTLGQWADTYRLIVAARPINYKTKANRRSSLDHILTALGDRPIGSIRPHEIAGMVMSINKAMPSTAKRVLIEAKDCFNEALSYGWIDRNPALGVKAPQVRVQRHRLTLNQWWDILRYSIERQPPWVSRMLALALATGQRRSDLVKMRFADVWGDHLHIEQAKTGARLALPVALRLAAIDLTLAQIIGDCRGYYSAGADGFMLRKHNGEQLCDASLSARFEEAREGALGNVGANPPSLHECRSLSERLCRARGIDIRALLGHRPDMYNDDRGLSRGEWKTSVL